MYKKNSSSELTTFPEITYMNGHKGIHVRNGIYKLERPFRINRNEWAEDNMYADYCVIGTNYSEDYQECDIEYFTNTNYRYLSNKVVELREKNNTDDYGYIENIHETITKDYLGGITYEI